MNHYQSSDDLKYITSLLKYAPQETQAYLNFDVQAVKRKDGIIAIKTRELIALAVALTTQCAYCINVHTKGAMHAGATKQELAELIAIAAAVRAGATMGHGLLTLRLLDDLKFSTHND